MKPFFFRDPKQVNRNARVTEDRRWARRKPIPFRPKQTIFRKVLAWLRGEGYDPTVFPKSYRKTCRAKARAEFVAKCRRRALRPQGCSIPAEVWK